MLKFLSYTTASILEQRIKKQILDKGFRKNIFDFDFLFLLLISECSLIINIRVITRVFGISDNYPTRTKNAWQYAIYIL